MQIGCEPKPFLPTPPPLKKEKKKRKPTPTPHPNRKKKHLKPSSIYRSG